MNNVKIEKLQIVGIAVRTTNQNGQSSIDIESLWNKFWDEDIRNKIPDKINNDIYAVYTDYKTDHTGPYTTIIGLPVSSLQNIPDDFVSVTIEQNIYQKFVSKGKMPDAVFNTWLEIWSRKDLNRSYKTDFTIHGKKYYLGDEAEVETYVSVKQ